MKKIVTILAVSIFLISSVWASFMYQETDSYCSISGTTHTSFPGEISDTSSWSIPTAYQWRCDITPELSSAEKKRIRNIMVRYFQDKNMTGPLYGWNETDAYGWENTLNPEWQTYINNIFFPTIVDYISVERQKKNPSMQNIAILNQAVKTIGYDYFLWNN